MKDKSHFTRMREMIRASNYKASFVEFDIERIVALGSELEKETNERLDNIKTTW